MFDCSGVIIDDLYTVWNANSDAYEAFGFKRFETLEEFKEKFKLPIPEFHRCSGIPEDRVDEVEKGFKQFYPKYFFHVKIFPEVKDVLEELKRKRISLSIVSNIPNLFLREHLQEFKIANYFDVITSQEDCNEQKPSPKSLLVTLEKLKARPEESAYVGDMEEDVIAGKRANVYTIAISRAGSYHPSWRLKKQNPDYFISSLYELLSLF
ncbi:MAG: HAD-IA family hydrolase [Candidatus Aenigmarchaeota archaeon]|nr:HAD-IA family hydrolase [Candidatus Aenigmarchaeota archaeon]